jgi:hypothetical protein
MYLNIHRQTHFNVNNDNVIAKKYSDLRSSTVSKSKELPEDGKVRPKHVASDVILMLFKIREIVNSFKLH